MTLPEGWRRVRLGEVADTALGKMLDKGRARGLPRVRYLRNVNVQWGRIDTHNLREMEVPDGERTRFGVEPGDLLVCEGGEIGRAAIWRGDGEYIAFQKALHRVRPRGDLDARFLRYRLEFAASAGELETLSTGSTITHLPQQQLRRIALDLPPLDEQRRIVELLEEHLSSLDRATSDANRANARVDAWLQTLLLSMLSKGVEVSFDEVVQVLPLPASNVEVRTATPEGRWPIVDQGESAAPRRTDNAEAVFRGPLPVVVFGDHTRRVKLVEDEFAVGGSGVKLLAPKGGVDPRFAYWATKAVALPPRGYGRHFALLRNAKFYTGDRAFQESLVQQMTEAKAVVDISRRALRRVEERAAALRRALLEAAFSGRFTGHASDVERAEEAIAS